MTLMIADLPAETAHVAVPDDASLASAADLLDIAASALERWDEDWLVRSAARVLATLDAVDVGVQAGRLLSDFNDPATVDAEAEGARVHAAAGGDPLAEHAEDVASLRDFADQLRHHEAPRAGVLAAAVAELLSGVRARGL